MESFLKTLYAQIKHRCTTRIWAKQHLYQGLEYLTKKEMLSFNTNQKFIDLYNQWQNAGKVRRLVPTLDRIDSKKGYTLDNIDWKILSDNSKLADFSYRSIEYKLGTRPCKKRWEARIRNNYKTIIIGYYDTEDKAHEAYLKYKKELGR